MKSKEAKHTPGPWSIGTPRKMEYGGGIVHYDYPIHVGAGPSRGNCFVIVSLGGRGAIDTTPDAVEANARLIAASPDLYEAGKALVERWDTPNWKDVEHTSVFINALRDAIAKVEKEMR